jgi:hypothetical protein
MTSQARSPIAAVIEKFLPGIRYPHLFAILAVLLGLDLVVPDPIPLVDELGLAVLTLLAGTWRSRRSARDGIGGGEPESGGGERSP